VLKKFLKAETNGRDQKMCSGRSDTKRSQVAMWLRLQRSRMDAD